MAKTRMTGFSRLLLFLIFLLPMAFAGASYMNGEDPIQKAKEYLGMDSNTSSSTTVSEQRTTTNTNYGNADLEKQILQLERDLAIAREELSRCKLEQEQNQ